MHMEAVEMNAVAVTIKAKHATEPVDAARWADLYEEMQEGAELYAIRAAHAPRRLRLEY